MSSSSTRKALSISTPVGVTVATTASLYFSEKSTASVTHQATRSISSHATRLVGNLNSRNRNMSSVNMSMNMNNSINSINGSSTLAMNKRYYSQLISNTCKTRNMNTMTQSKQFFSSEAVPSPPTNQKQGFVQWYEGHLEANPVKTKAITGSILWGMGDIVAQVVPKLFFDTDGAGEGSKSNEEGNAKGGAKEAEGKVVTTTTAAKVSDISIDGARLGRAMFFGFAIHAPLSHVHYNFLEWMTVRGGFSGLGIPVFKAFMEQFVYWSWFSNSLYHGAMGFMTGMTPTQIYDRIADVLWETQKAQWVFWIPVQLLNFRFVPVRHQLNVVLMTSVVWTALLSAWYPPEEAGDGEKIEDGEKEKKKGD